MYVAEHLVRAPASGRVVLRSRGEGGQVGGHLNVCVLRGVERSVADVKLTLHVGLEQNASVPVGVAG